MAQQHNFQEDFLLDDFFAYKDEAVAYMKDGSLGFAFEIHPYQMTDHWDEATTMAMCERLAISLGAIPQGWSASWFLRKTPEMEEDVERYVNLRKEMETYDRPDIKTIVDDRREVLLNGRDGFIKNWPPEQNIFPAKFHSIICIKYKPRNFLRPVQQKLAAAFGKRELYDANRKEWYDALELLKKRRREIRSSFIDAGLSVVDLGPESLYKYLFPILNPETAYQHGVPSYSYNQEFRQQLFVESPEKQQDGWICQGQKYQVATMVKWPDQIQAGFLSREILNIAQKPICLLDAVPNMTVAVHFTQKNREHVNSQVDSESDNKWSRGRRKEDILKWRSEEAGKAVFGVRTNLIYGARNQSDVDWCTDRLINYGKSLGAQVLVERHIGCELFLNSMPFNYSAANENAYTADFEWPQDTTAAIMPSCGLWQGTRTPASTFVNARGEVIGYDIYDYDGGYNTFIAGQTGSGKSVLLNCILMDQITLNARVVIIEKGGSMVNMTKFFGGTVIPFDLNTFPTINPVPQRLTNSALAALIKLINALASSEDPDMRIIGATKGRISRCIKSLYESHGRAFIANPSEMKEYEEVDDDAEPTTEEDRDDKENIPMSSREVIVADREIILGDIIDALRETGDRDLVNIADACVPFTEGEYGRIINGKSQLDLSGSDIICFDMGALTDYPDLKGVLITVLLNFVDNAFKAEPRARRKILALDEVFELLKPDDAVLRPNAISRYLESLLRQARKSGIAVILATQQYSDIDNPMFGKDMISQIPHCFFLALKETVINQVSRSIYDEAEDDQKRLELKNMLGQCVTKKGFYAKFYYHSDNGCGLFYNLPSARAYWITTTDKDDVPVLEQLQKDGMSLWAATCAAAQKYPAGVLNS